MGQRTEISNLSKPEPTFNFTKNTISTIRSTNRSVPSVSEPTTANIANMSDAGEIEVESSALYEVLPKDVVKEVGNVKLFNKWDYDVEVRDISLTYVLKNHPGMPPTRERNLLIRIAETATTFPCETPSTSPTPLADMPPSDSARPTAPSLSD